MTTISECLEQYIRDLANMGEDRPHVIFLVGVNGVDPPSLHAIAAGVETPTDLSTLRLSRTISREESDAPWTLHDLIDASRMLWEYQHELTRSSYGRTEPIQGHEAYAEAVKRRESRSAAEVERVMSAAAYIEEHPHLCVCGRRFKSERGIKTHQRACWKIDPFSRDKAKL